MGFYDYSVTSPDGTEISMKDYEGKTGGNRHGVL